MTPPNAVFMLQYYLQEEIVKFPNWFVRLVINHHRIRMVFVVVRTLRLYQTLEGFRLSSVDSPAAIVYWECLVLLMSLSPSQDEFTVVDVRYGSDVDISYQPISWLSCHTKTNIFEGHESSALEEALKLPLSFGLYLFQN